MGQREDENHVGHIENPAGDDGSDEQRSRRDRRDFVAAQDVGFAFLHGADPGAEKSVAEDADDEDHGNHHGHGGAAFGVHRLPEDEEENQRKQVVEENYRPVA